MKKYNLFKVLVITVVIAWLLTLIIPGSYVDYSGGITKSAISGVGIFGLLSNLNISISYFNGIAIFLIAVACFYAVLNKTESYEKFIKGVTKKFEGKQSLLVILTTIIYGVLSIFLNDFLLLILFVPFIYKVMEKLEIDKKIALASTLVSALIGSMCSIYNSTLFSVFSLKINTLLLVKVILFVLSISVLLAIITPRKVAKKKVSKKEETKKTAVKKETLKVKKVNKILYLVLTLLFGTFGINKFYAGKIKSGVLSLVFCWTLIPTVLSIAEFITLLTEKSDKDGKIEAISTRRNNVSFAVLLVLFVLFVIGSSIPWEAVINKLTIFTDFNTWLTKIKIGNYNIFSNIIGSPVIADATYGSTTGVIAVFGTWQLTDIAILLFVLTAVIAIASNMKFDNFVSTVTNGIKNILPVAITAMLISIVLVIIVTTGINITIVNAILTITKGFNIATSTIATLIGSLLTSDFYYLLSTSGSVFTTVITNKDYYGVIAFIIQTIYNFAMIFAPTSVGLVIGLYYLNIPYNKWLKFIWKLLLALFIIIIITTIVIYALV